jgi:hypothetical protein
MIRIRAPSQRGFSSWPISNNATQRWAQQGGVTVRPERRRQIKCPRVEGATCQFQVPGQRILVAMEAPRTGRAPTRRILATSDTASQPAAAASSRRRAKSQHAWKKQDLYNRELKPCFESLKSRFQCRYFARDARFGSDPDRNAPTERSYSRRHAFAGASDSRHRTISNNSHTAEGLTTPNAGYISSASSFDAQHITIRRGVYGSCVNQSDAQSDQGLIGILGTGT